MFFQGIRTSIAKKPYIFVIFRGGGGLFAFFKFFIYLKFEDFILFLEKKTTKVS